VFYAGYLDDDFVNVRCMFSQMAFVTKRAGEAFDAAGKVLYNLLSESRHTD
jgi:hypothetical protein